jgi:hypothetical protein
MLNNKITSHYFHHDDNAMRDIKILKLREVFGARGYGLYWMVIEYLFSCGGKADYNFKAISMAIGEDKRTVKKFMEKCIEDFGLFERDESYFWSNRLLSEIDRIVSTSQIKSRAARVRHTKKASKNLYNNKLKSSMTSEDGYMCNADAIHVQSTCTPIITNIDKDNNTIQSSNQRKVTSLKSKKQSYGEFSNVKLSESEYLKGVGEYGHEVMDVAIAILSAYKESSGRGYKSDYAAMRNWVFERAQKEVVTSNDNTDTSVFRPRVQNSIFDEPSEGEK